MGLGVLVGVSLMIVLTLAAALALRRHNRVDRQRDETPEDRYRREAQRLRPTDGDSWRAEGMAAVAVTPRPRLTPDRRLGAIGAHAASSADDHLSRSAFAVAPKRTAPKLFGARQPPRVKSYRSAMSPRWPGIMNWASASR